MDVVSRDSARGGLTGRRAEAIKQDGIVGLPGALRRGWGEQLNEDFEAIFTDARSYQGGTVSRGPNRYYLAIHPERLRGFLELVTHPAVVDLCEEMLGPDYEFVEVGFDVPLPGAVDQPWHRDFPSPPETIETGRLSSLVFNVPACDVTPEMGPFEVAPGTHRESGEGFAHAMFPPKSRWPAYETLKEQRCPSLGDMSARTGLVIHRGTANHSRAVRPVMVLGAVCAEVPIRDTGTIAFSREYFEALPDAVRVHLRCAVVENLEPIQQEHSIEGLVMGA
jgi:hypothetical protein